MRALPRAPIGGASRVPLGSLGKVKCQRVIGPGSSVCIEACARVVVLDWERRTSWPSHVSLLCPDVVAVGAGMSR